MHRLGTIWLFLVAILGRVLLGAGEPRGPSRAKGLSQPGSSDGASVGKPR